MMSDTPTLFARVASAVFFCVSSFVLILINKTILTTYKFSAFEVLGLGQIVTAIVVLFIAKLLKIVDFPPISIDVFKQLWPLPLLYIGNLSFGLGGTQKINLPMFTVLRRFSILFTMIAERIVLGIAASLTVQLSVATMVGGAVIAALNDLAFNAIGYTYILMNNVCTAANNVYIKQKLGSKDIGKFGVIFYNSLFMVVPWALIVFVTGKYHVAAQFTEWHNPTFICLFGASCFMGFVLNYSILLCTLYNSALTTTIMGVIKNLLVTYVGMLIGGDYVFSWLNFIGLNISVLGSVVYTYATFKPPSNVVSTPA